MKNVKNRVIAIALAIVMIFGAIPMYAFAATGLNVVISNEKAMPGSRVAVKVSLQDNPGISSMKLSVSYDSILILESVEYNTELGGQSVPPQTMSNPVTLTWVSAFENFNSDATFATLIFRVAENAEEDAIANITATFDPEDVYDLSETNVNCVVKSGTVVISSHNPGDINDDGIINNKDASRLLQYLAEWDVTVVEGRLDVNNDNTVNNKDASRLLQYLAGWNVEIFCCGNFSVRKCQHVMHKTEAVEATCEEDGNIAYWHCDVCEKYFVDEAGQSQITFDQTVVPATGHNVVIDPAASPTYDSTGLTEGSHCSNCNKVLVEQIVIPMLEEEEYAITYDVCNGDAYLQEVGVTNSNPNCYVSEDGLTLKSLKADGYRFLGWYDLPAGSAAEIVKSIPIGATGEIELFAHWEKEVYDVEFEFPTQFNVNLVSLNDVTYTVDKGTVLPTPSLDGYIFTGWSDADGKIIKKVPVGSTGAKQYTANWLSKRNQAWTKQTLDNPIVIEDEKSNTILFTYEIGEIRNVPVDIVEDFGYVNSSGVSKTVTKTYAAEVQESLIEKYENTISNATVNSYGWTLSNDWSNSTSIDEEWCESKGITTEEAEEHCKSDTSGWYVSKGSSGSTTTETLDTKDTYDLKTSTKNSSNGEGVSDSKTRSGKLSNSLTVSANMEAEANAKVAVKIVDIGGGIKSSAGISDTLSAEVSGSHSGSYSKNKSLSTGNNDQSGSIKHTGTNTTSNSSWNSESGYNGSSTLSSSTSLSKAVSESISNKYGYGKTYVISGGESSTQGLSSTDTSSDTYGSTVTFSTVRSEEETVSYTTTNTVSGYHRWVMADTAHVFAVVGYDIATSSYFVYTYTVMEDNLKPFEDYSCSSNNYDDNQNTFIGFEVPYETITGYVANRVGKSEGLEINGSGVVTGYTGTDEYVVVPEYIVISNQDNTNSVIKVTGIAENAFKGNTNITGILLSTFIDTIPANAFKGCTSLIEIEGCVTSIGDEAFSGCTAMKAVALGWGLNSLGENAFDSAEDITLYAINEEVVAAVTDLGVKNITVYITNNCEPVDNITFSIADTTEKFAFNGYGKTFSEVFIISDAAKTVINRASFTSGGKTPLQISSADVELQEVIVNSPAIGLICSADNTNLNLYGESHINSDGTNTILCKNLSLGKIKTDYFSRLNSSGNVLVCGEIENGEYLSIVDGEIIYIDDSTFDMYKNGVVKVTFDVNGGSGGVENKTVYYGQKFGELPALSRDYYTFEGWYTDPEKGEKVTSETTVTSPTNQTLYAHWTIHAPSGWVKASEVPSGAQKVNQKWSYNLTSYTTSSSSTMSGWERYNTTSRWSDYGSWSSWQDSWVGGSDSRQVETQQAVASYNYKTVYHYFRYAKQYYDGNGWYKYSTGCPNYYTYDFDEGTADIRYVGTEGGYDKYQWWYNNQYDSIYGCSPLTTQEVVSTNYKTQYRYRDRSLIYTYYFKKVDAKESTSYPTGENISNIQEWVQYRAK